MTTEVARPKTGPRVVDRVLSIVFIIPRVPAIIFLVRRHRAGSLALIASLAPVGCAVGGSVAVTSVVHLP